MALNGTGDLEVVEEMNISDEMLHELLENGLEDENGVMLNFDLIANEPKEVGLSNDEIANKRKFEKISQKDVETFLEAQQNRNTARKTAKDMKIFRDFLQQSCNELRIPEIIPPHELNNHISSFLLSVRKLDGSEYEPVSLRAYLSSIERYLKNKNYLVSVATDIQFQKCREVLKLKQKQLKGMGKGNKPFAADDITDTEINKMYEAGVLGCSNPIALSNSLFMMCTNHFGMRPGKEVHDLKWGDVKLGFDNDTKTEYVIHTQERQTKTRTGANVRDTRKIKPRAYAVSEYAKNPVALYKLYKQMRPAGLDDEDSPFFLAINKNANLDNPNAQWYKKNAMGINKLYSLVKEMKVAANLTSDRRLTNYSMRKHLVQKLSDAGVPPTQIVQISGHKNLSSLNNYSKINHQQNLQISNILSVGGSRDKENTVVAPTPVPSAALGHSPSNSQPKTMSIFHGNNFHGVVNVNYYGEQNRSNSQWNVGMMQEKQHVCDDRTGSPSTLRSPPRKYRRILPIDSDSD